MTRAHEGSTIVVRNAMKSLPEGMFLFPFDGRVFDTTNTIPLLGTSVITFRDATESKFIGSVAVEDATTNLLSSPLDISASPWTWSTRSTQINITKNATISPSGQMDAHKIETTTTNKILRIFNNGKVEEALDDITGEWTKSAFKINGTYV